jgi:hypothetical protein
LDEKLMIANEFMTKHALPPTELRHLRRAMAVQFNSTLLENMRTGRWRVAATLIGRLGQLGTASLIAFFAETCRFACRVVAKQLGRLVRSARGH